MWLPWRPFFPLLLHTVHRWVYTERWGWRKERPKSWRNRRRGSWNGHSIRRPSVTHSPKHNSLIFFPSRAAVKKERKRPASAHCPENINQTTFCITGWMSRLVWKAVCRCSPGRNLKKKGFDIVANNFTGKRGFKPMNWTRKVPGKNESLRSISCINSYIWSLLSVTWIKSSGKE